MVAYRVRDGAAECGIEREDELWWYSTLWIDHIAVKVTKKRV